MYRSCRHMSFLKGHKFASICHVHIIFCNNTRYVPLKIGHYIGSPFLFQYNELPLVENITLHRHCLWDILHVEWDEERIDYKYRSIPLREHLNVPLKDKLRLRWILKKNYQIMYMVKQGDTWYNLRKLQEMKINVVCTYFIFSTRAERGSWSMVQESGGKAVSQNCFTSWYLEQDCNSQNQKGNS